jgi:hypothetical protein
MRPEEYNHDLSWIPDFTFFLVTSEQKLGSKELWRWAPKSYGAGLQRAMALGF